MSKDGFVINLSAFFSTRVTITEVLIHSFIFDHTLFHPQWDRGLLGPIPADLGPEAGHSLNGSQFIAGPRHSCTVLCCGKLHFIFETYFFIKWHQIPLPVALSNFWIWPINGVTNQHCRGCRSTLNIKSLHDIPLPRRCGVPLRSTPLSDASVSLMCLHI